jgi:ribbon-helix-helix CopG family protein
VACGIVFDKIKQTRTIEEETMGRMRENPRYNVISMRISDEEKDTLEQIIKATHKSVSDIMRDAMELLKARLTPSERNQRLA